MNMTRYIYAVDSFSEKKTEIEKVETLGKRSNPHHLGTISLPIDQIITLGNKDKQHQMGNKNQLRPSTNWKKKLPQNYPKLLPQLFLQINKDLKKISNQKKNKFNHLPTRRK